MARERRAATLVAVGELFGSDFTLIGVTLAGLALTSLGILHDLGPFHIDQKQVPKPAAQGETP